MAKPTIVQLFGTGAAVVSDPLTLDTITAANPALVIPFSALAGGNLNVLTSMADGEKMITAILNIATAWYVSDSTEDPLIEASVIREATQTRRNQRMRSYAYELTVFKPLPASPTIDPDTLDIV